MFELDVDVITSAPIGYYLEPRGRIDCGGLSFSEVVVGIVTGGSFKHKVRRLRKHLIRARMHLIT